MLDSDMTCVCIDWIDNRKGIMCISYEDGNKVVIHRKQIIKPEKGLRKLKKGDLIEMKIQQVDMDEWCVV